MLLRSRRLPLSAAVLLALAAASACGKKETPVAPPPTVEVAPVTQKDVSIYQEWIGTLDGFVNAEIRPQIEGYVLRRAYREGFLVKTGETLFEIDPRQFQATYDQAQGTLAQYEATLANAKTTWRATGRSPRRRRSASRNSTTPRRASAPPRPTSKAPGRASSRRSWTSSGRRSSLRSTASRASPGLRWATSSTAKSS